MSNRFSSVFTSIIAAVASVFLPTGGKVEFTPTPEGGMFQGKLDPNLSGPGGYTYGFVTVQNADGRPVNVSGYVCHHSGGFHPLDDVEGLIPLRAEPDRIGLGKDGFQGVPATV